MLRQSLRTCTLFVTVALAASSASAQAPAGEPFSNLLLQPGVEATPASAAEVIARPVSAAQPVASYDTRTGTWIPSCNATSNEWMPELEIPAGLIDCTCDGSTPGSRCQVWRSYVKPSDPSVDRRCVVCVKEPCLGYETVEETLHAVVYRCFESTEPFKHEGCESGRWYEAKGTTRVRKLHPCEAKVPVKYQKPVIKYRDVYYYIQCDKS